MSDKSKIDIYKEAFNIFLIENGIYYLYNEYKDREKREEGYYYTCVCRDDYDYLPSTWISDAFTWVDTKEGFDFWNNINGKWANTINGIKIQHHG